MCSRNFAIFFFVFAITLVGCSRSGPAAAFNESASLVGKLPANPLQWKIITSALNTSDSTMSTLYGNDAAVQYARTHPAYDYPVGSVLSLVTWTQADDARWFGAKIPNQVKSVEFVFVRSEDDGSTSYSYEKYEGAPLALKDVQQSAKPTDRAAELLSLRAAVLP